MFLFLYIAEERQDQNAKRRKLNAEGFNPSATINGEQIVEVKPSAALQLTAAPSAPPSANAKPQHHALPPRPSFNSFESEANALGLGAPAPDPAIAASAIAGITGSDKDWVRNRHAIRMANMSAAEMLKAEMMSARPVKAKDEFTKKASPTPVLVKEEPVVASNGPPPPPIVAVETASVLVESTTTEATEANGSLEETTTVEVTTSDAEMAAQSNDNGTPAPVADTDTDMIKEEDNAESSPHGTKRKADEVEDGNEDEDAPAEADDDEVEVPADPSDLFRMVKADGTVEQEDTVKYACTRFLGSFFI